MPQTREKRYRDFCTVVYPDSKNVPSNWIEILKESHLPIFYVLHDKDMNPDNLEKKKAHYHVMIMFESPRTKDNAVEFINSFGGVGCELVKTRRGMARYLIHRDNPEKYQYSSDDVVCLGGADFFETTQNNADEFQILDEIINYIKDYKIENILEIYDMALSEVHCSDWRRVVIKNIFILDKFCSANYKHRVYGKGAKYIQEVHIVKD